jgi:hypothetical protein
MSRFNDPRTWIIIALATAGVGASTAFVTSSSPAPEPEARAASGLDGLTKDQVIAFAGGPPERCVYARPDREVCTWKLEGTLLSPGAAPAAAAAADGVNLICELPIKPDADFEGTCTPHARAAAADLPPVSAGHPSNGRPVADAPGRPVPVPELDDAASVLDLSQRLGDAPDVCRTGLQKQTCIWRIRAETAARSFALVRSSDGPVELRCTLPLDGRDRAPGSCSATPVP